MSTPHRSQVCPATSRAALCVAASRAATRIAALCTAALCAAALGGCAALEPPRLYYETIQIRHNPLDVDQKRSLIVEVKDIVEDRPITWRDPEGRLRDIQPRGEGLAAMDMAALHGLWMAFQLEGRGGEVDLVVTVKDKKPEPVSVVIEANGDVRVTSGLRQGRRAPPEVGGIEGLRDRYGLGPLTSGRGEAWDVEALQGLELALGLLGPQELEVVKGMAFIRYPEGSNPTRGALYSQEGCEARIFIYNHSLEAARRQFTGSPDAPLPPLTLSALHEIGHAVHVYPSRRIACALEPRLERLKARQAAYNAAIDARNDLAARANREQSRALMEEIAALDAGLAGDLAAMERDKKALEADAGRANRLANLGPVLAAYRDQLKDQRSPTRYGEESLKESFAESFALFHADPEALRRVLPEISAWFERGGHVEALVPDKP